MASPVVAARLIATFWLFALLFKSIPSASAVNGLITSVTCTASDDYTEDPSRPRQWSVTMTNLHRQEYPQDFLQKMLFRHCKPSVAHIAYDQSRTSDDPNDEEPEIFHTFTTFESDRSCTSSKVDQAIRDAANAFDTPADLGFGGLMIPMCSTPFVPKLDVARKSASELPEGGSETHCTICGHPLSYYDKPRTLQEVSAVPEVFDVRCPRADLFHAKCILKWYAQHTGPEAEKCPACGEQMAIDRHLAHKDWTPYTY